MAAGEQTFTGLVNQIPGPDRELPGGGTPPPARRGPWLIGPGFQNPWPSLIGVGPDPGPPVIDDGGGGDPDPDPDDEVARFPLDRKPPTRHRGRRSIQQIEQILNTDATAPVQYSNRQLRLNIAASGGFEYSESAGGYRVHDSIPRWNNRVVEYTDLTKDSATTAHYDLYTLPAAGLIHLTKVMVFAPFSDGVTVGPGYSESASIKIGPTGTLNHIVNNVTVTNNYADDTFHISTSIFSANQVASTTLRLSYMATGGDVDNLGQGWLRVWFYVSIAD